MVRIVKDARLLRAVRLKRVTGLASTRRRILTKIYQVTQ